MENQRNLRSKTGASQANTNMAANDLHASKDTQLFKTPVKQLTKNEKGEKPLKIDKTTSSKKKATSNEIRDKKETMENPLNQQLFHKDVDREKSVEETEHINQTPKSSPAQTNLQNSTRKKMLSTRNGQLIVEIDDTLHPLEQHDQQVQRSRLHASLNSQQPPANDPYTEYQHDQSSQDGLSDAQESEEECDDEDNSSQDLTQILRELSSTVKRLEKTIGKIDKGSRTTNRQVSAIETIQSQDSVKIRGLVDKIDDQEDKINALIGIVIKQDQQIQALTNKIDVNYVKENKNNLFINGVAETPGEDCYREVTNFFKNVLKIEKPIHLTQAFRVGKGPKRPILAKLKTVGDKADIYTKTDKLREINRGRDNPYFIADQIPDAWAEKKRVNNFFKQQNARLPIAHQHQVEVKKGTLLINKKPYVPAVRALTTAERCNMSPEQKRVLRQLEIVEGPPEQHESSKFCGYAAEAYSTDKVQKLYEAMCLRVPDATHIMCAYRFPGLDLTESQGFIDNGEHGAGRLLLNLLQKNKIQNKVVFVTRHYGGQHIGPKRFQLIEKAASAAISILLKKESDARKPLTPEQLQELNQQIQQQASQRQQEQLQLAQNPWHQAPLNQEEDW